MREVDGISRASCSAPPRRAGPQKEAKSVNFRCSNCRSQLFFGPKPNVFLRLPVHTAAMSQARKC